MNLLLYTIGVALLFCLWAVWKRTRAARGRSRLRRLYAQRELEASVADPVRRGEAEAAAPQPVDDRQMNLFNDVHQAFTHVPVVAPGPRPAHPLRRRTDRPGGGERLDWQYFNKDAGNLGYPEAPERRRPNPVPDPRTERPERRA